MSTVCTPATTAPVEVTDTARTAGLAARFRVVMTGHAHHRALTLSEHPETSEGVADVVTALGASLGALFEVGRPLTPGTTWTIRTGEAFPTRWAVLVAEEHDPTRLVLYLTCA